MYKMHKMYQNNYAQLVYEMPKKMRKTREMKRRKCKSILSDKKTKRVEKAYRELFMPRNRNISTKRNFRNSMFYHNVGRNFRKRFEEEFEKGFMKHCMNSPHKKITIHE
jgi:hypothetical protein